MTIRIAAFGFVCALFVADAPAAAQTVNLPPANVAPRPPGTPSVEGATCEKFSQQRPQDLLNRAARDGIWDSRYPMELLTCIKRQHEILRAVLTAPDRDVHEALAAEFLTMRRLAQWVSDVVRSYQRIRKDNPNVKNPDELRDGPELIAELTNQFESYRFDVRDQAQKHNLLQPFSGVLKAGAAFLERGSSTETVPTATREKAAGTASTTSSSPLAHIDFESKHFGAERGSLVDASFTSSFGFQPALAFFKPHEVTINNEKTTAAEATAYENAFVFNVGGNLHVSKFHVGEVSVTGRVGAVNLVNDVTIVEQGAQSYIAVPFGGDNTRLYGEVGVMANLYDKGLDMAHLEKTSLMPLFHIEAGFRRDPRFGSVGPQFFNPTSRTFLRVSADNVPVLAQLSDSTEAKTFSLAFAWEYEGPSIFGNPGPGQLNIPSGNRFVIRGDVNLLKALKSDVAAPSHSNAPLVAPVDVRAQAAGGQVVLSWHAVPGAASYVVYRRIDPDKELKVLAPRVFVNPDAITVVYVDRTVADPARAFYKISASRGTAESDRSAEFSIAGLVPSGSGTPGTTPPPGGTSTSTGTSGTGSVGTSGTTTTGGIGSTSKPPVTPPAEGARQTLSIDVFNKEQKTRVVAHVIVDDNPATIERDTDGNGHVEFNLVPGPRGFSVTAHDFEQFREPRFDNSLFGNPPGSEARHVDVHLQPKPPAPAPRPGRDRVLNMRANFFGGLDCRGARIFDPMIAVVTDRECWYSAKKADGLTHIVLSPAFQYPGFTSFDWWHNDPAQFRELMLDVLNHGFVPVVLLAQGEHFTERNRGHVTNPALTEHLDRDFERMLTAWKDLAPFAVWVPGWEVVGPPEYWWTAFQLTHAIDRMTALLGDSAVIAVHAQPNRVTGASYCGQNADRNAPMGGCVAVSQDPNGLWNFVEADDPSRGDEIGWFSLPAGRRVNLWLFQMDHDRRMADDGLRPCASAYGRVCETLRRWVAEDAQTGKLKSDSERGPQWFPGRRGPQFCAFETGALNVKQGDFAPEKLKLIARRLADLGVTCFGNGVP